MDKNNIELFKQAITEGLCNRIDSIANSHTQEIECSKKHNLAMMTIVYGKTQSPKALSLKMKRLIAILIAAALLLTSCGIIFRNEIREFYEEICNFFIAITYNEQGSNGDVIEKAYELGYLPDGYLLVDTKISPVRVQYYFENENNDYIWFEQIVLDGSHFVVNDENGYNQIYSIDKYDVFYSSNVQRHLYLWNDGEYSITLSSNTQLSDNDIISILDGIIK